MYGFNKHHLLGLKTETLNLTQVFLFNLLRNNRLSNEWLPKHRTHVDFIEVNIQIQYISVHIVCFLLFFWENIRFCFVVFSSIKIMLFLIENGGCNVLNKRNITSCLKNTCNKIFNNCSCYHITDIIINLINLLVMSC